MFFIGRIHKDHHMFIPGKIFRSLYLLLQQLVIGGGGFKLGQIVPKLYKQHIFQLFLFFADFPFQLQLLQGKALVHFPLDGFLLDDIIIEKGFVEELISAIDDSTMTAVADDISSYETAGAVVSDEALQFFPDIRKWNANAVLTRPRVIYKDGERAKERLAIAYRDVLKKAAEAKLKTLSIAPLSDYPLSLEGDIASSSVSVFFSLHPETAMAVTFVLPDEESLSVFLSSEHQN